MGAYYKYENGRCPAERAREHGRNLPWRQKKILTFLPPGNILLICVNQREVNLGIQKED
jgi:hypothetical protein